MLVETLAQKLLFNTLRIEALDQAGQACAVGTGFVLAHDFPEYGRELFLVTNKHVTMACASARIWLQTLKDGQPEFGHPFELTMQQFQANVFGHPNPEIDVAIVPMAWWLDFIGRDGVKTFLTELDTSIIISDDDAKGMDAVESVLFVGYPNGLYDTVNFTPLFRRGTTASPYQLDYCGLPAFVIDASVFGGSSGSPVFRHLPTIDGHALATLQLLGIVSSVFFRTEEGRIELRPTPTTMAPVVVSREMLDLGVVFKAHLIRETIDAWWERHRQRIPELIAFRNSVRTQVS